MKIKIINATILDNNTNEILYNISVCINGDIIEYVGENDNLFVVAFNADKVIDFEGDLLSAGFINCHAHNAMSLFRGLKDDVPLEEWLFDNMLVIEKYLTEKDIFYGTQLSLLEGLKSGITTNLDAYFYPNEIIDANIEVGTRVVCCIGAKIYEKDRNAELIKEYEGIKNKNDLVSFMAYAHSIYGLSTQELEDTVYFAKDYKLPMHIHLAETLKEVGDCVQKYNRTPVQLLEDVGFLEHKCLIAHGVHIEKDDFMILTQHDTSIAHCPASNLKLGSGIAPIHSMSQAGINICLGTDGPASNNSIDMFREMYLSSLLQKVNLYDTSVMPAEYVIKMATENGAKALCLNNIGKLEAGYKADLIRISTKDINMIPLMNSRSFIYSAKPENVKMTMVNGVVLYENGEFAKHIDVDKIIFESKKSIERLKSLSNL